MKISHIATFLAVFLLTIGAVFAAEPGEVSDGAAATVGIIMLLFFLVIGVVAIVAIVFWILMLIDCVKRQFDQKVLWIIILVFTGWLGAILYYFLVKRKGP